MVTQQKVGAFYTLHINLAYACAVKPSDGERGNPHNTAEPPRNSPGFGAHIEPTGIIYQRGAVVKLFCLFGVVFVWLHREICFV